MAEFGNANLGTVLSVTGGNAGNFNSADLTNQFGRGCIVRVDLTLTSGTISVVPKIQGKIGNNYYDIVVGVAITATGVVLLRVFPGLVAAANLTVNDILPTSWRVRLESGAGVSPVFNATVDGSVIM